MIELIVKYSPEYEVERVKETLGRLSWYKDNGYSPKFPSGLEFASGADISEVQIQDSISAEYREDDYKIQEVYLLERWHKLIDEASTEIKKTSLNPRDTYTIYLTKYGVGGSYNYPDSIIMNIKSMYYKGLLSTVFHEIVHLTIHLWITENKVSHWQKERIVDLLTMKFAPQIQMNPTKSIPTEITKPVDKIFNEHYPDIELIIKNIGLLPLKK